MKNNDQWQVRFSGLAAEQLVGIFRYLLDNEDVDTARELVKKIRSEGHARLKALPYRGRVVPELIEVNKMYREIQVKPYRLIYRVVPESQTVSIVIVMHSKQDLQEMVLSLILE